MKQLKVAHQILTYFWFSYYLQIHHVFPGSLKTLTRIFTSSVNTSVNTNSCKFNNVQWWLALRQITGINLTIFLLFTGVTVKRSSEIKVTTFSLKIVDSVNDSSALIISKLICEFSKQLNYIAPHPTLI